MATTQAGFDLRDVVNYTDDDAFSRVVNSCRPILKPLTISFARDRALSILNGEEDLFSIVCYKLYEACRDFKYDDSFDENRNKMRFFALVRKYASNILIDHAYKMNLCKRKPTNLPGSLVVENEDNEEGELDIADRRDDVVGNVITNELLLIIAAKLDQCERKMLQLHLKGYKVNEIASATGQRSNKVRVFFKCKLLPVVSKYVGRNDNRDERLRLQGCNRGSEA